MDERSSIFSPSLFGVGLAFVVGFTYQHHFGSKTFHVGHFDVWCRHGHADDGAAAQLGRRHGHALRVVSGRGAHHAIFPGFGVHAHHLVVGATQLEGENRLAILSLQPQFVADGFRQPREKVQFALARDVVHLGAQHASQVPFQRGRSTFARFFVSVPFHLSFARLCSAECIRLGQPTTSHQRRQCAWFHPQIVWRGTGPRGRRTDLPRAPRSTCPTCAFHRHRTCR
mmetsp:Transcript_4371/g.27830  ORF Transcript_4371/g.27830 Transcript_4371/m.27830 type:complete len:227 (+) Transcript_4371:1174-1854(+)